jgi:hypothetical protein
MGGERWRRWRDLGEIWERFGRDLGAGGRRRWDVDGLGWIDPVSQRSSGERQRRWGGDDGFSPRRTEGGVTAGGVTRRFPWCILHTGLGAAGLFQSGAKLRRLLAVGCWLLAVNYRNALPPHCVGRDN